MDDLFQGEFLRLREAHARRSFIDEKNEKVYATLLNVLVVFFLIALADEIFIRGIQSGRTVAAPILAVNWMFILGLWAYRHHGETPRNFAPFLLTILWIQVAFVIVHNVFYDYDVISLDFILTAVFLSSFWLRPQETLRLFATLLVLPWAIHSISAGTALPLTHWFALKAIFSISLCAFALWRIKERNALFHRLWQHEVTRNRERMRMKGELEHAREIQLSMLPKRGPDLRCADLSFRSIPATEVGGDYFDFFQPTPSILELVIGDVSGHGVAAGIVLSGLKSSLQVLQADQPDGARTLDRLDRMLKRTTDNRTFVTLLYTRFDFDNQILALANAGHVPFIHYDHQTRQAHLVEQRSMALGCAGTPRHPAPYSEATRAFHHSDVFVFFTDGLLEMMDARYDPFGMNRIIDVVETQAAEETSAYDLEEALIHAVQTHMGDTEQFDDITVAVLKV